MNVFTSPSFGLDIKKVEKKTFNIEPGGYISVSGDEGFIKVSSWDRHQVRLIMTKRAWGKTKKEAERNLKTIEVSINEYNNRLEIKLVKQENRRNFGFWDLFDPDTWSGNRRSPKVDFELTVPKEINLNLENDEGDVTVESIVGDLEIAVDEGDIKISDIQFNELSLSVDEGDIDGFNINNPGGRISLEMDEGDLNFENVHARRLRVECDEGDVQIKDLSCNSCSISSDEGDIELDVILDGGDRYRIVADEGTVSFYLPSSPDVKLDLETSDGSIRSDFDIRITKRDDTRRCRDMLGNGAASIEVRTDEGTIYLRRR